MKPYEALFIFPPEATPEVRKNQDKNLEELLKKFGGTIVQKTEWGKKLLGYPLKKFREGYFLLLEFQMESLNMTEFRKGLELQEGLLKFMVTVKNPKTEKRPVKTAEKIPASAAPSPTATTRS